MTYTSAQLLAMSQQQLDDIFGSSPAGDVPSGEAQGTAIIASGTVFSSEIAEVISLFGWKGKTFDAVHGTLRNRLLAFESTPSSPRSTKAPAGSTARSASCSITRRTSTVASHIRDEIRQIGPGMYLGIVFWDKKRTIHFALQF